LTQNYGIIQCYLTLPAGVNGDGAKRRTAHHLMGFLLSIALLLAGARLVGALARRLGAPPVVGEILAGVVLGRTLLGRLLPEAQAWLFPPSGPQAEALGAVTLLGSVLLLFVAGLEVDIRLALKQGRAALATSLLGDEQQQ